ncbi:MAG TPA: hypothetical protein VFK87_04740 [Steroidobacteraceae bacterium]|nr:hypothetical protein [Steroidobacteraceae bacterium]
MVRTRFTALAALAAVATLAGPALVCTAHAATTWAETLAARALSEGPSSRLPPHLSAVLGLASNGQGLAVRQLVARDGFTVRTFNVGAAAPHRVVVIVADEAARSTTAYLLTARGRLRRAVGYHSGEAPRELPAGEAQSGFAAEVRFWSGAAAARAPAAAH